MFDFHENSVKTKSFQMKIGKIARNQDGKIKAIDEVPCSCSFSLSLGFSNNKTLSTSSYVNLFTKLINSLES